MLGRLEGGQQLGLAPQRAVTPDPVDCAVASRRQEPCTGTIRDAVARPAFERDRNGVLKGVLGEVEVAEGADQARQDTPPLGVEDGFELVQCSTTGRTSIAPPFRAAGIFEANSIASSIVSHSTR